MRSAGDWLNTKTSPWTRRSTATTPGPSGDGDVLSSAPGDQLDVLARDGVEVGGDLDGLAVLAAREGGLAAADFEAGEVGGAEEPQKQLAVLSSSFVHVLQRGVPVGKLQFGGDSSPGSRSSVSSTTS